MKLKKIASLMLAGIMAVSMLAGCNGGTPVDDDPASSTPVVSDVVEYANGALSGTEKGVFTFKSSTELDTALQAAANDKSKFSSKEIEDVFTNNLDSAKWAGDKDHEVADLKDVLSAVKGKISGIVEENLCDQVPDDGKSQKAVDVYVISGALEEKVAIEKAVDMFNIGETAITAANYPNASKGSDYTYTYSAEISAVKVASADKTNNTAWVVAIVVTQTATAAANAN